MPFSKALLMAAALAAGSPLVAGAAEPAIGTVRQIYDGKLRPDLQAETFRNIDKLFPTRTVKAGGAVREFPASDKTLEGLEIPSGEKTYDLYDYLSMNRVGGLLVLKDGKTVFEDYELGNTPDTRWMSMSVVKSISSTLVAAAIRDGAIKSLQDPLTDYMPELKGSSYERVSVRDVLLMSSGVRWNETYTDPASDRRRMLELQIEQKAGTIVSFMAGLPRAAEPGTAWNYSTGETHMLGALIRAATGKPLSQYLSEKIWVPAGMESDATWWLESPDGLEVGGSGLSARLRDYARFGQFILDESKTAKVLPEGWVADAGVPHEIGGKEVEYGYMWWPVAQNDDFKTDRAFSAIGIFGQFVYVNPARNVVIAMWGSQSKPEGSAAIDEYDFLEAVARSLD